MKKRVLFIMEGSNSQNSSDVSYSQSTTNTLDDRNKNVTVRSRRKRGRPRKDNVLTVQSFNRSNQPARKDITREERKKKRDSKLESKETKNTKSRRNSLEIVNQTPTIFIVKNLRERIRRRINDSESNDEDITKDSLRSRLSKTQTEPKPNPQKPSKPAVKNLEISSDDEEFRIVDESLNNNSRSRRKFFSKNPYPIITRSSGST